MKAARVLPEPVGAAIRTLRLALMAGQACACAGVGPRKLRSNQAVTAGCNSEHKLMFEPCRPGFRFGAQGCAKRDLISNRIWRPSHCGSTGLSQRKRGKIRWRYLKRIRRNWAAGEWYRRG